MTLSDFGKHAAVVVATAAVLLLVWEAIEAVAVFLCSLAVGAALLPAVEALKSRGWPSGLAVAAVAVGVLAIVGGLGAALVYPVGNDVHQLEHDIASRWSAFERRHPDHWSAHLARAWRQPAAVEGEGTQNEQARKRTISALIDTGKELTELGALVGMCFAISLYWTMDRERFERLWFSLLPVRRRTGAQKLWSAIQREVGAYLRSEVAQSLAAIVLLWSIFYLLGLRYAALMAIVAGILTLVPWLGTVFSTAAVLILASPKIANPGAGWVNAQSLLAVATVVLVLCFLEFLVEPRLFPRGRYNSLWTVLTAVTMTVAWGPLGLLFGPPAGYVLQIVFREVYPRLVYEQAEPGSLEVLWRRVEELQTRLAAEETAPEVQSLAQRLATLAESQRVAVAGDEGGA